MANNRLWLVDDATGERILLAKSNGGGWWLYHEAPRLNEWLEQHDAPASYGDCPGKTTLRLAAENDDTG